MAVSRSKDELGSILLRDFLSRAGVSAAFPMDSVNRAGARVGGAGQESGTGQLGGRQRIPGNNLQPRNRRAGT